MTTFQPTASHLACVLALCGGIVATPASAQSTTPQPEPTPPNATQAAASSQIADITVTARRRSESLSTTPVSATVLSGDDLTQQNVRSFQDLRGAVSNLELVPLLSGGTSFTIRGIGQTFNQVNSDAKAGFYVDEMYVSRQEGNDLYFYDIASLQVLKGPQGTLFGKNTTAGAVLLTTQRPTDRFEGYVQLRAGSLRRIDTEGALNVPLTDGVAARASFRTQSVRGFIRHVLDDGRSGNVNNQSGRLQVRVDRGGPLSIDLLGEYNRSATDGGATIPLACLPGADYIQNYDALHRTPYCTAYPVLGRNDAVYGGATLLAPTSAAVTDLVRGGDADGAGRYRGLGPFNRTTATTLNGRVGYDLGGGVALHSVTAYRRSRARFYTPVNNAPDDIYAEYDDTRTSQFTQELTIGGSVADDRLTFLAGVFYFQQKTRFLQDTGPDWIDPLGYVYDATLDYRSYAGFAQASYKVTPRLELTLGARYTYDRKRGSSYVFFAGRANTFLLNGVPTPCGYFTGDFLGGLANCAGAPFTARGRDHWDGFDPKLQLSYRWSDAVFTYLTAAHGYNAGGFNQQLGGPSSDGRFPSSYDPEKLWSYEAGIKLDLLDRRAVINLSAFYQTYTDIQAGVNVLIGTVSTRQVQSAASAHEAGMEAEVVLRPLRDLTLRGNAAYLTQGYDSIRPNAVSLTRDTPVNSAPKYTFSAAIAYDLHLSDGGTVTPSVDVRGVGAKPACQSGADYVCRLPAYALVGFRLDYAPRADGPWRIGLWGTNLFDRVTQQARTGFFGGFGIDRFTPGRPRELGVETSLRF
ncbi:TonB-dependent receptor [Sphingomonas melonis]|uniref:Iron complex outermembrane receptor protein n=1 Tax=Sphingomonas melonis TaxID=152682 RepID=A0A7Y9FRQ0_9SPHN|nr:TonB-dependent receptor [Sphingomonas melonis]NYD92265.1 iron complex outermembrane receptor protein [Sphingomonas melonis]